MRYRLGSLLGVLLLTGGCAGVMERLPGYTHTAFLPVNGNKGAVTAQVEHVLGMPKRTLTTSFVGSSAPVEVQVYPLNTEADLALFFQGDQLVFAILPLKDSPEYPDSFDKTAMLRDMGYVRGYAVSRKGNSTSFQPVF